MATIVSRKEVKNYTHDLDRFYRCLTKVPYMSPVTATRAAYALECIRPGRVYDVYECRYCADYHVGRRKRHASVRVQM